MREPEIIRTLDAAPFTRRHGAFAATLLAAVVFDYAKPFTISFVIPGMREMWNLSEVEASYLAMAGLSGTLIGSIFWGFIADKIGRRATLLWTISIFSLATLCGLASHYWHSLVACLIMGFGVGGEVPVVFALGAEYLPVRARARVLLSLAIFGATGGYALAAATAAVASALFPDHFAWRLMWLVQLLPGALIFFLRRSLVPESARFLLMKRREEEARQAAQAFVGHMSKTRGRADAPGESQKESAPSWLYGRTLALSFFSFAWGLANFGFIIWLPTLLRTLGYGGAASSAYLALSALIALPAVGVTTYLLTRWSAPWTLGTYAALGGLTLLALGLMAESATPPLLVLMVGLVLFFVTSIGGGLFLYSAEVFPTATRASLSGIVAAAGKLGGVVGPYIGGLWLAGKGSILGLQLPPAAALLAAAFVLAWLGIETRGRRLEEIGKPNTDGTETARGGPRMEKLIRQRRR